MPTSTQGSDTKRLPMMTIRGTVIFPFMRMPLVIGIEPDLRAFKEAMAGDGTIFVATQHDASVAEPKPDEIYSVGTIANIVESRELPYGSLKVLRRQLPDCSLKLLLEGKERATVVSVSDDEGFFRALVRTSDHKAEPGPQLLILTRRVTDLLESYVRLIHNLNYNPVIASLWMLQHNLDYEAVIAKYQPMIAANLEKDPGKVADMLAASLQLAVKQKQGLLEIFDPVDRLARVADLLNVELEKLKSYPESPDPGPNPSAPAARGRRSMNAKERKEVSERMKQYWTRRRQGH